MVDGEPAVRQLLTLSGSTDSFNNEVRAYHNLCNKITYEADNRVGKLQGSLLLIVISVSRRGM